ncbi:hypothetical protein Metbo_1486 [Methanobacterium lacus]|uniref:Uncharacterized protein n=1 Tax=Methanobacterium lacus (strain AL-21) TaxID=877455 RepID=F0T8G8_METLA|nr:hypothetical protein [Methanobacterium lacus]ADZ09719.1 hypothetical protein Metbo_1486 [Methanobacterium lacus]
MDGLLQMLSVKVDMIVSAGSVLTLLALIIIYLKNYKTFKTKFSLAILLFVSLFFMEELIYTVSVFNDPSISISLQTLINIIELIGFLIILSVARY